MANLDEVLFRAWQSGDEKAQQEAWLRLWKTFDLIAVRFCCSLGFDDSTAEQCAVDALHKTIEELEQKIRRGEVRWEGIDSFVAFVRNRLILRCRDECRRRRRIWARTVSLDAPTTSDSEEGGSSLLDLLGFRGRSPEEEVLAIVRVRETIRLVAVAHEICRRKRALAEVLKGMKRYLHQCLAETIPSTVDAATLTFDRLLQVAALESLDVNKTDMYQFLMQSLGINRNTLDLRMRRIHALLWELRAAEDD